MEFTQEELDRMVAGHKEFLASFKNKAKKLKLTGKDLSGADLSQSDLRSADFKGANLENANLSGANLRGANLQNAKLYGANLNGANLIGANIENSIYEKNDVRGIHVTPKQLETADILLKIQILDQNPFLDPNPYEE